ncbi:unnamed protein product [Orchesella dallaii]|uniref:C2H2-type domain-containing protein n=1 Tax=Orchesella dallaii TaxID=48710 RepID=A0ABP1RVX0_9HEXA
MDSCLFCASYCHPPKLLPVGVLEAPPGIFITADVGIKQENEESPSFSPPPSPSFPPPLEPSEESTPEQDSVIQNSLKVILILKRILQIPDENLCQFLTENGGQSNPDSWVQTCSSCGELVTQFYELLKELSKLQRKLVTIETELKGRIVESKDILATSSIWARIRCQVLKEYLAQLFTQDQANLIAKKTDGDQIKKEDSGQIISSLFFDTNSDTESADEKEDEKLPFPFKSRQSSFTPKSEPVFPPPPLPLTENSEVEPFWNREVKKEHVNFNLELHPETPLPFSSRPLQKQHLKTFPTPKNETMRRKSTRKTATVFISEDNDNDLDNLSSKLTPNSTHLTVSTPKPVILPRSQEVSDTKTSSTKSVTSSNGNGNYIVKTKGNKRTFKCSHCPYIVTTEQGIQGHLKLHEKGSRAIACEECGYFVLPERLKSHRGAWHATYKTGRIRYKKKSSNSNFKRFGKIVPKKNGNGIEPEKEIESLPPPPKPPVFHCMREKIPVFFQCDICPYKSRHKGQLDTHLEAHREGSGASRCADCGWKIFAGKLDFHLKFCPDPDGKKEKSFEENGCEEERGADAQMNLNHLNGCSTSVNINGENQAA